jgi:hypothetical protein
MRSALLLLMSLPWAQAVWAEPSESLTFAIYRLTDGERTLIAEGMRDYTSSDIDVVPWGRETAGYQRHRKSLELADGFGMGIVSTRQFKDDGFGLWVYKDVHPGGFSWEWFDDPECGVFKKLRGTGEVRVTFTQIPNGFEIRSVEFLTDVTLRFTNDLSLPPDVRTHEVVIYAGSVFRVAPRPKQ